MSEVAFLRMTSGTSGRFRPRDWQGPQAQRERVSGPERGGQSVLVQLAGKSFCRGARPVEQISQYERRPRPRGAPRTSKASSSTRRYFALLNLRKRSAWQSLALRTRRLAHHGAGRIPR